MRINWAVRALTSVVFAIAVVNDAAPQTTPGPGARLYTSLSDVQTKGELVVGVDIPYGVMEYYDSSGAPVGIDMDIADEIAAAIGVSRVIRPMPFANLFAALKNGEVDVVISAVTITPERQTTMLFSAPYLDAGLTIAVRKDNSNIRTVKDLQGRKVGVLKGTTGEDLVNKSGYTSPSLVISYENNDARLAALIDGELDAAIVHFLVKEHPSIKLVGAALTQAFYGVVTRLDANALMDEINMLLRDLKRSEKLNEIKKKYLK